MHLCWQATRWVWPVCGGGGGGGGGGASGACVELVVVVVLVLSVLFGGGAVGFPLSQTALVIGGLWGVFFYREIVGVR